MKKHIDLYWYKYNKGFGNFGDELNHYIIRKLSSIKVNYIDANYIFDSQFVSLKMITKELQRKKINFITFLNYLYIIYIRKPEIVLAIGSVLHSNHSKKNKIWGSGIIHSKQNFVNSNFLAVRGYYTISRMKELGYEVPKVIGDPALLLPIVLPIVQDKKFRVGIIPHFQHYIYLKETLPSDFLIINLLDSIEDIVKQINSCELILSTSLHGIIVSHAYQIPAVWVEFKELQHNKLLGDNVKFLDYFSSINLPIKEPMIINTKDFSYEVFNEILKNSYKQSLLPDANVISQIQKNLLSVAPFSVKKEFL